ncbi:MULTISPECIES: cell envelope integrity protein TolA [unclassified Francisella]|uniref:cell envelope integrity protein TolA n=1 Tax=unclassified Francisella TaxID=2610885 RepID=UPI002E35701B|nr:MULTISPECIES: cell envelope integrity protein TolA [unclassified Francisella]MED7818734.1 cell envelope integrity protein TolA [Francisella sp. 19S2-4]MED7829549.1 cell envelope integrity protein TolA [Francisella sp. 19S2-10]
MANLNYQKILQFCKKQIDQNPYVVKALLIHVGIVLILYILSYISVLKFDSTSASLSAEVANTPKQLQVIQATSISSSELNKQIANYENRQQEIRQARQDVKQAKQEALQKHKLLMKQKAEAERKAKIEAQKQAALEAQQKEQEKQRKIEQEKQAKLEAEQKAKEEAKKKAEQEKQRKIEQEKQAKLEAERKARQERLAKARAEAIAAAKKEAEQNQAQRAIASYILEYQTRVGDNWIKDPCRGIYNLPRAIIRNGNFIKLTGTSGSYMCDQSLINAIKNTTPPQISNSAARKTIQTENISFIFKQT